MTVSIHLLPDITPPPPKDIVQSHIHKMGGKIWTDGEETVFWGEVAILAPPGHDSTSQKAKSHSEIEQWEPLADKMKREMLTRLQPGEVLRRTYTAISCCV